MSRLRLGKIWEKSLKALNLPVRLSASTKSANSVIPGSIVSLEYQGGGRRLFLIVSSRRTSGSGHFISTKLNNLLCCFEIISRVSNLSVLLKVLYRNRGVCSYQGSLSLLILVFGSNSFKTLNFLGIQELLQLDFPIHRIPNEEYDEDNMEGDELEWLQ